MVFTTSDVYTTSGSTKLYGCWTEFVTKHDTSSFYNWETDNEPIHDLEERTYLNWEKFGFPTSSVTGFALVVSGHAGAATGCDTNIFTTVSAAVNAIPEVINFPILLEVGNFGNLGDIKIHNFKFGPRGSLEIINRSFGKGEPGTYNGTTLSVPGFTTDAENGHNKYKLCSSVTDFGGAEGWRVHFTDSSCVAISATVLSATTDPRLNINTFNAVVMPDFHNQVGRMTWGLAEYQSVADPYIANGFRLTPYEYNADSQEDILYYDASAEDAITTVELYGNSEASLAAAWAYGSHANKISIRNCDGPVYLRNFFVNGGGVQSDTLYGIEVDNCSEVYLENCAAAKCRKAGVAMFNSKVYVLRGLHAYRCYDFDPVTNTRKTGPWLSKKRGDFLDAASSMVFFDDAAGILAVNSHVMASSTSSFEYWNNFTKAGGRGLTPILGEGWLLSTSRCANGLVLINSTLTGGQMEDRGLAVSPVLSQWYFQNELNVQDGIVLDNSRLSWDGRLLSVGNGGNGITARNSFLDIDKLSVYNNQRAGLEAKSSFVKYNKNLLDRPGTDIYREVEFSGNGQHVVLESSVLEPYMTSSMPIRFGMFNMVHPHGVTQYPGDGSKFGVLPAVSVMGGSRAIFVHPRIDRKVAQTVAGEPCYGAGISVTDNSTAIMKGTTRYATKVIGPNALANQDKVAGVYAGTNSVVEFHGPTIIARWAIDVLAEDNSTIELRPHRDRNTGALQVSAFDLHDAANHTSVELHATRACLVANRGSVINMKDLGDFTSMWTGTLGLSAIASSPDYDIGAGEVENAQFVSGGYLQFYPNPMDATDYNTADGPGQYDPSLNNSITGDRLNADSQNFSQANGFNYYLNNNMFAIDNQTNLSGTTGGGMCLRAVGGSVVNAMNVHFPTGWWNPSGIIYDTSGQLAGDTLCSRLFVWNIADNSRLHASLLSVSGNFPGDVGYHGPSGCWAAGGGLPGSSMPAGTPDTGIRSILDLFGRYHPDANQNPWGFNTFRNTGPFRLYFSTNPTVNNLTLSSGDSYGLYNQVFAQGYNASGPLSAYPDTSTLFGDIVLNAGGNPAGSGTYYASAMVDRPGFIRCFLDESAANTFANSKHCATRDGRAGLSKIVSIYYPYRAPRTSESSLNVNKTFGKGFRSVNIFDLERDN